MALGGLAVLAMACFGPWLGAQPALAATTAHPFWREAPPHQPPVGPSFAPLVERLAPAVVNVYTSRVVRGSELDSASELEQLFRRFFGEEEPEGPGQRSMPRRPRPRLRTYPGTPHREQSLGSGFILSADGFVVTNDHVVGKAGAEIKVRLLDEREFSAKVIGRDRKLDLALLKLEGARDLPTVVLGDSNSLRIGDTVIAVGNPFGLGNTVTAGIVSAKGRVIGAGPYDDFIQTDASINPGNSGGPLFNLRGEVVGISAAIVAQGRGIGFAIPIDLAKGVLEELRTSGHVTRGLLGVHIQHVDSALARAFGLPRPQGALVAQVEKGSPAERAGLAVGDVVLSFNGQPIDRAEQLPLLVARARPGSKAQLEVLRNGRRQRVAVTVGEAPSETAQAGEQSLPASGRLGISVRPTRDHHGVVVEEVDPNGAAAGLLQPGDIIVRVGPHVIHRFSDLARAEREQRPDAPVAILVMRDRTPVWVTLPPLHRR